MKKHSVVLLLIAVGMFISSMTLCNSSYKKTSPSQKLFDSDYDKLVQIIEFISSNNTIREITSDSPGLFYDYPYTKINGVYYITNSEVQIDVDNLTSIYIKDIMKKSVIRIIPEQENGIMLFQTDSKLGEGEYLVYTEYGTESSDEYLQLVKWINEHWYIAKS